MFRHPPPNTEARLRKEQCNLSPKVKPTRQSLLRLLSFAWPYWWQLGLLMGAAFVTSTLNLTYPALMGTIIDSVLTRNLTALHTIVFFLLGLAVLQSILSFGQGFWMSALGERIILKLRIQLYGHLQYLPLSFFQDNRTGELLSRLTNDVTRVQAAVTTNIISIVQNIITLGGLGGAAQTACTTLFLPKPGMSGPDLYRTLAHCGGSLCSTHHTSV